MSGEAIVDQQFIQRLDVTGRTQMVLQRNYGDRPLAQLIADVKSTQILERYGVGPLVFQEIQAGLARYQNGDCPPVCDQQITGWDDPAFPVKPHIAYRDWLDEEAARIQERSGRHTEIRRKGGQVALFAEPLPELEHVV